MFSNKRRLIIEILNIYFKRCPIQPQYTILDTYRLGTETSIERQTHRDISYSLKWKRATFRTQIRKEKTVRVREEVEAKIMNITNYMRHRTYHHHWASEWVSARLMSFQTTPKMSSEMRDQKQKNEEKWNEVKRIDSNDSTLQLEMLSTPINDWVL